MGAPTRRGCGAFCGARIPSQGWNFNSPPCRGMILPMSFALKSTAPGSTGEGVGVDIRV